MFCYLGCIEGLDFFRLFSYIWWKNLYKFIFLIIFSELELFLMFFFDRNKIKYIY